MPVTNKKEIKRFYGDFAGDKYLTEIRRFGLRYDEMIDTIVGLLLLNSPKEILDIGCGIGNVEEILFAKSPKTNITCVEISPEMIEVAKKRLEKSRKNLTFTCKDILEFKPEMKFDAIFSNLAIHNLSLKDKIILLKKVKEWLKPNGVFILGDFMNWEDKSVAKHFMDYRNKIVLESGVDMKVIEDVFAKEEKDPRLTVTETIDLLRDVDFKDPEVLWVYSFLAIFRVRKK